MNAFFTKKDKKDVDAVPAVAEKDTKKTSAPKKKKSSSAAREGIAYRILVQPHVTEKAGILRGMNQYVFRVDSRARKQEIAQAIKERYGVQPSRVNTVRSAGKKRRLGKSEGFVSGYKKAIITLPEGKTIDISTH